MHPALDLFSELPNGDRGVVATSPIEEGTTLVTCPHALTLHVPTAEQLADRWGGAAWLAVNPNVIPAMHPSSEPPTPAAARC